MRAKLAAKNTALFLICLIAVFLFGIASLSLVDFLQIFADLL